MSLAVSPTHLDEMHRHLESLYPQEGCGILLGTIEHGFVTVHQVMATANVWNNTSETDRSLRDRYEIDPSAMLAAMKSARELNLEIVGIYHSHPDHPAIPSECDRSLAWAQYIYVICSVDRGSVCATTAWQLDAEAQFRSVEIQASECRTQDEIAPVNCSNCPSEIT
jgi:proteasome lid subunit RPN8/RPN11